MIKRKINLIKKFKNKQKPLQIKKRKSTIYNKAQIILKM